MGNSRSSFLNLVQRNRLSISFFLNWSAKGRHQHLFMAQSEIMICMWLAHFSGQRPDSSYHITWTVVYRVAKTPCALIRTRQFVQIDYYRQKNPTNLSAVHQLSCNCENVWNFTSQFWNRWGVSNLRQVNLINCSQILGHVADKNWIAMFHMCLKKQIFWIVILKNVHHEYREVN